MRASCPPPRNPIVAPGRVMVMRWGVDRGGRARPGCVPRAMRVRGGVQRRVGGGEHLHREQCGVGGAGLADGDGGDGDALRHLHDREQRVDAGECGGGDGDADHGHERLRGEHAGQVRRATGGRDDHAQPAPMRGLGVPEHLVGGAVCGDHTHFVGHAELLEEGDGGGEDGEVAGAAHHDANERRGAIGSSRHAANMASAGRWRVVSGACCREPRACLWGRDACKLFLINDVATGVRRWRRSSVC